MKNKCEAVKKNGEACSAWAMPNGYCRRHGGNTAASGEEEKVEPQAAEAVIEAVETQEKKPAKKQRRKRKRKPKKCGALTTKGTLCTFKVMANGRCGKHQGAPDAPPEITAAASQTLSKKEEKTGSLEYSAYISTLIDKGEEEVFQEYFDLLHKDFNLNGSSDRMNSEIACIYYVKLLQAIKSEDIETVSVLDQLLRDKLDDLKAAK